jgi:hypothetical protein
VDDADGLVLDKHILTVRFNFIGWDEGRNHRLMVI